MGGWLEPYRCVKFGSSAAQAETASDSSVPWDGGEVGGCADMYRFWPYLSVLRDGVRVGGGLRWGGGLLVVRKRAFRRGFGGLGFEVRVPGEGGGVVLAADLVVAGDDGVVVELVVCDDEGG